MDDAIPGSEQSRDFPPAEDGIGPAFRSAMRRLASTVTIVTAGRDDDATGMTATAVTSLTTEPPALLVCINRTAGIHPRLVPSARFCVNILAAGHHQMSSSFGGAVPASERFASGEWMQDEGGLNFLADAQSNLFCVVDAVFKYGTHSIVVGKVVAVRLHGEVRPLLYGDGRYFDFETLASPALRGGSGGGT